MAGPQEIFKQHLIKNEEQPSFSKRYSAHFGAVSTTLQMFLSVETADVCLQSKFKDSHWLFIDR